jgi:hypothetical protein
MLPLLSTYELVKFFWHDNAVTISNIYGMDLTVVAAVCLPLKQQAPFTTGHA